MLIWGTFPVPIGEQELFEFYNNNSNHTYRTDLKNYPLTSSLFDKFLKELNAKRSSNNKTIWNNIYKLSS